jgi:hypothetical protein
MYILSQAYFLGNYDIGLPMSRMALTIIGEIIVISVAYLIKYLLSKYTKPNSDKYF